MNKTKVEKKPLVKVILEGGSLPEYKKPGDAGADVRVIGNHMTEDGHYFLENGETRMISLGMRLEIPQGWEIQVRSRSGLAKIGLVVANSPGTIDSSYRGICMVLLHNQSGSPFRVDKKERVAQFVLKRAPQAEFVEVSTIGNSERGEGGFGSTGTK